MHAGSGDTHFGVVDNLIQRNPVTNVPVIHSSGIKGALREYFDEAVKNQESKLTNDELNELFGEPVDNKPENPADLKNGPGHLIFFESSMITVPLRSNQNVYYNCTSEDILLDYLHALKDFELPDLDFTEIKNWTGTMDLNSHDFYYFKGSPGLEIEDFTDGIKDPTPVPDTIKMFLSNNCKIDIEHLAVFNKDIFNRICQQSIPVVARNQIKSDGTSGNLFYEEVLPRKSKLYFILGYDSYLMHTSKLPLKTKFEKEFENKLNIYQFGGNYSIGYGFSKIEKVISRIGV
jgi:CRISPR-associated protein Cmr4